MAADGGPDSTGDKVPPPREEVASDFSRLIDDAIPAHGATLDSGHRSEGAACFSEVSSVQTGDQAPSDVGRYRLGRLLGEGGMGSVFEGEQVYPVRRKVAVKLIKLGMDTRQVVARFQAERQALAIMNHPNIARVFDAGATDQGRPFFAMELVEGEPITEYCDKHNLSTRQRLDLFVEVCNAVQHAHTKGVIHRDLKPSNVLVTLQDGRPVPKVIDFGVAKATEARLTERTLFTEERQFVGTPEYMSPEQAGTSGLDVDTRTDVYSLGVLLYELLTGLPPFDGRRLRSAGYAEIQRIIREEDPPRPSTRVSSFAFSTVRPGGNANGASGAAAAASTGSMPAAHRLRERPAQLTRELRGDLDLIVMRSIEKDRTRRYESPGAFAADIRRHLSNEPVDASPPNAVYRFRKFARRHTGALMAGLAVALALLAGFVTTVVGFVRASQERTRAVAAEEDAVEQRDAALRSEADAVAARDQAQETTKFLTDMLTAVNPSQLGREVSVREVLDEAAKSLASFADRPLIEARLHEAIGRTYQSLGHLPEAEPHLTQSLEMRRQLSGPDHDDTIASLEAMAGLLKAQARYKEAEPLFIEAFETSQKKYGQEDGRTFVAQNNLAGNYRAQGLYSTAEPLFVASLAGMRRTLGNEHPETLTALNNLALLYRSIGRHAQSLPLAEESLRLQRKVHGDEHPDTLLAMHNLGLLYLDMKRFDESGAMLKDTLERRRRVQGDEHPDTLLTQHLFGGYYHMSGQFDKAVETFESLHEIQQRVLGETHERTLRTAGSIARVYLDRGAPGEAEPRLRAVLELQQRALGPQHRETLITLSLLGNCLMMLKQPDEGFVFLEQSLDGRRNAFGDAHPDTIPVLSTLAVAYRTHGRLDEAAATFARLLAARRTLYGGQDARTLSAMQATVQVLVNLERFEEAEALALECQHVSEQVLGPAHEDTVGAISLLVLLYDRWQKPDEEARWRAALSQATAATRPTSSPTQPKS